MLQEIKLFVRDEDVRGFTPGIHFTKVLLSNKLGSITLEDKILQRIQAMKATEAARAQIGRIPDVAPPGEPGAQ